MLCIIILLFDVIIEYYCYSSKLFSQFSTQTKRHNTNMSSSSELKSSLSTITINSHPTTFVCTLFSDRILLVITQLKTFGSMFTVGESVADGVFSSSSNQLTAKCVLGHREDSGLSETVCARISELLREKVCFRSSSAEQKMVVLPPLFVALGAQMEELRQIVQEAVECVLKTMNE